MLIIISDSFVIILFTLSLVSFPYLIVSSHPTSCRPATRHPAGPAGHSPTRSYRHGASYWHLLGTVMVLLLELYPWLSH